MQLAEPSTLNQDRIIAARLRVLEHLAIPVWVYDIDAGRTPWANSAALEVLNATSLSDLKNRPMGGESSPLVVRRLRQYQSDFWHGASFSEFWTFYPGGKPRSIRCVFSGYELPDGRMAMMCQALAERSETPETLRSAQALLHTTTMISLYSSDGTLLYNNPAARDSRRSGDQTLRDRFVNESDCQIALSALDQDREVSMTAQVNTPAGLRWHEIDTRPSIDAITGSLALLVTEVDISDRMLAEQKVHYLAHHDVLTGLPNRITLQSEVSRLLALAESKDLQFALLFVDLDRFKNINDSLGHAAGDNLLVEIGNRLGSMVQPGDMVARLGGDEFVVLLADVDQREQACTTAEEIRSLLSEPIEMSGHTLSVTPSIGISFFPDDGETFDTLMVCADLAMYEAKDEGRNRFKFFAQHMTDHAKHRLELEYGLREAVTEDQLELHYQPRVSVSENRIVGVEALLRWDHPEKGLLNPAEFIPIAEESGRIEEIGHWVMQAAARQQHAWQAVGHDISVSINLSPRQFRSEHFLESVEDLSNDTGCDPSRIVLEITESMLMDDTSSVLDAITCFHQLGFSIAIDDFGTGYSNLAYLQKYPIDSLKIDRSFINDPDKSAITQLIISMGKLLDVNIIAEGVEDPEQIEWLRELGCHEYQGFCYSRPVPVADIDEMLKSDAGRPRIVANGRLRAVADAVA